MTTLALKMHRLLACVFAYVAACAAPLCAQTTAQPSAPAASPATPAAPPTPANALPPDILQSLVKAGMAPQHYGIYIAEPGTPQPVVEAFADQPYTAASTMKLVTTIAALELLGANFRWSTPVLVAGRINQGVIEGHLIVRGSNDPSLNWQRIDELVKRLRKRGIHTIQGNIVIDRRLYSAPANETAAYFAETSLPWNSPPDSLVVNGKTIVVKLTPEARSRSVNISVEPPLDAVKVSGEVAYADGPCSGRSPAIDIAGDAGEVLVRVDGTLALACGPRRVVASVLGNREYFQHAFTQLWKASGGEWHGQFADIGPQHARAVVIDRILSAPMAEVVREINKNSNNLMSRQLFLQLAISDPKPKVAGSLVARAFDRVRRMYREHGIELPTLAMDNGAGVSNAERFSPRELARMLEFALTRPYAKVLMASLPIAGVDGTLIGRLRQSPAARNAFLKTGSLPEVRSLAGYVRNESGRLHIAVLLVNHRNAWASLPALDATVDWLYRRPSPVAQAEPLTTPPSERPQGEVVQRKDDYRLQTDPQPPPHKPAAAATLKVPR